MSSIDVQRRQKNLQKGLHGPYELFTMSLCHGQFGRRVVEGSGDDALRFIAALLIDESGQTYRDPRS